MKKKGTVIKILKGNEALELAFQGVKAWNEFMVLNDVRKIDFRGMKFNTFDGSHTLKLDDYVFNGYADFTGAVFENSAIFSGVKFFRGASFAFCEFKEVSIFNDSTFSRFALFREAKFKRAHFDRVNFESKTDFSGAIFDGTAGIGANYQYVPDFRQTYFAKHLSVSGMSVSYQLSNEKEKGAVLDNEERLSLWTCARVV